jgi:protein phosphatase 1L
LCRGVQVIVCSDGLFDNAERGGGGGLTNQQIVDICVAAGDSGADAQLVADELCKAAQASGSTDDVTAVLMQLR